MQKGYQTVVGNDCSLVTVEMQLTNKGSLFRAERWLYTCDGDAYSY